MKVVLSILFVFQLTTITSLAANSCHDLFVGENAPNIRSVDKIVSRERHTALLNALRSTLSGKLATVWRSEWKTKLSVERSNDYVYNLVKFNLSPETLAVVLKDLDPKAEGFTRKIHQRMYELQTKGMTSTYDKLTVRDAPPPAGATDSTFTYYTKPIIDSTGTAKHQPRIRTYLREINFNEMIINVPIHGLLNGAHKITIVKENNDKYYINVDGHAKTLTSLELQSRFGKKIKIFAPHGENYKLEIKSALDDMIKSPRFTNLNGNHNVQKLDISLTQKQVETLFAPFSTNSNKKKESLTRLENLQKEIITKDPSLEARAKAVLAVLAEGIKSNSEFLKIEGATAYHRSAFESNSGFQTTIDRDQGVYLGNMYSDKGLKNPIRVLNQNFRLKTGLEDARHVELKLPINLVVDVLGVKFTDPNSAGLIKHQAYDQTVLNNVVGLYNNYVTNKDHPGKFNYLRASATELIAEDGH